MSGWFDSFNQAVGFTEDPAKNARKVAGRQLKLEREMFEYQKGLNEPFYNAGLPAYYSMVAGITGEPQTYTDSEGVTRTATYNPTETEGYKYRKERTLADLGRQLRMLGRSNSTAGINARTRTLADLNAENENTYMGRLADLTNIARGGASSLASAATGYGQRAGDTMTNANLTGLALKQNNTNNMWNGLGQLGNAFARYYQPSGGGGGGGVGDLGSFGGGGSAIYGDSGFDYGGLSESDWLAYDTAQYPSYTGG